MPIKHLDGSSLCSCCIIRSQLNIYHRLPHGAQASSDASSQCTLGLQTRHWCLTLFTSSLGSGTFQRAPPSSNGRSTPCSGTAYWGWSPYSRKTTHQTRLCFLRDLSKQENQASSAAGVSRSNERQTKCMGEIWERARRTGHQAIWREGESCSVGCLEDGFEGIQT